VAPTLLLHERAQRDGGIGPGSEPRSDGGLTLAQRLHRARESTLATGTAECPVCGGRMRRDSRAASCGGCGSRLE
jgi:hypothetical protein